MDKGKNLLMLSLLIASGCAAQLKQTSLDVGLDVAPNIYPSVGISTPVWEDSPVWLSAGIWSGIVAEIGYYITLGYSWQPFL